MTLSEAFARDQIFIDFGAEIIYGSEQADETYPKRFPTVGFQLVATEGLTQIADRIRKDMGFKPMHPMDEYTEDTCDNEGWYDFFVGINGYGAINGYKDTNGYMETNGIQECGVDNCIDFIVENADSPDNEERYTIYLEGNEQDAVLARLDEQCRTYLGKSCEELLEEARMAMNSSEGIINSNGNDKFREEG